MTVYMCVYIYIYIYVCEREREVDKLPFGPSGKDIALLTHHWWTEECAIYPDA